MLTLAGTTGSTSRSHWLGSTTGLAGFVTAIGLVVLLVMAVLFVVPAFIFLLEVLIVGLVVAGAVALRVVLRRPWIVDAFPLDDPAEHLVWKVVGAGRAKETVDPCR